MKKLNVDIESLIRRVEMIVKILVNTQMISRYRSIYMGKGLEFEEYRNYIPGDDAKAIDWKASVRVNDLMVKEYVEERNLDVYILLDVRSSMIFGSTDKLKLEYAIELAAVLSYISIKANDKVGMIFFNDRVMHFLPARTGDKHFYMLLKNMSEMNDYGGGYRISEPIDFLMKISTEKGVMFIVSDFIGMEEGWQKSIRLASTKFDVIGAMIKDPVDIEMPNISLPFVLQDPYSSRTLVVNPAEVGPKYREFARREIEEVRNEFYKSNADLVMFNTKYDFIKPLFEFFIRRRMIISM